MDWSTVKDRIRKEQAEGRLGKGGLPHGHTFLRLCDIRGYQNLLFDMIDEEPRLWHLIDMVTAFNVAVVEHYVNEIGVDQMRYGEDLGMQIGPMLSPELFRKYIKPIYARIMAPARQAGNIIHMHSDGDIRSLAEDLIEGGVQVLNPQDLVNGIDWIRDNLKGRVFIELDIDRQKITPYGTPEQVDALIREEVTQLAGREGGFMMAYGLYPGIPLANIKALMDAMEKYAFYYH